MGLIERFVFSLIALALAITVGILVWKDWEKPPLGQPADEAESTSALMREAVAEELYAFGISGAISDALDDVDRRLADFREVIGRDVEKLIADHGDETTMELDRINATVAETIAAGLTAMERRIADAVAEKFVAAGCTPTSPGECPPTPCPPDDCSHPRPLKVESRHTLLYENARLIDDEVTVESFGVKLAQRHVKRLELLTNALQPCHQSDAPVVFNVTGYSSTAEFRSEPGGEPMPNSDRLNRDTANLRAQIVGDYLESQRFSVKTTQWSPDHDMQRPYRDDAQPGMAQQALNRTVFLDLESAGACELGP